MTHLKHECYDPPSQRDLRADVGEQEDGNEPGDFGFQGLAGAGLGGPGGGYGVFGAVDASRGGAEGVVAEKDLEDGETDLVSVRRGVDIGVTGERGHTMT